MRKFKITLGVPPRPLPSRGRRLRAFLRRAGLVDHVIVARGSTGNLPNGPGGGSSAGAVREGEKGRKRAFEAYCAPVVDRLLGSTVGEALVVVGVTPTVHSAGFVIDGNA